VVETTTDRAGFMAKIIAEPEEDTHRLAYADWLDENGEPDRAEFIRVQCELAGMPTYRHLRIEYGLADGVSPECRLAFALRSREDLLLAVNHEWSRCECRGCKGTGKVYYADPRVTAGKLWSGDYCGVCHGTGDLLRSHRRYERDTPDGTETVSETVTRTVRFRRGFVDEVECRLTEVCREEGAEHVGTHHRVWTPTLWAKAVVACLPVTRFRVTDATIHPSGGNDTYYVGGLGMFPQEFWSELEGLPTRSAASDALALVVARWVRGEANRAG
jgi:uncharacterized protein (TIGR02996 family)